MEYPNESPDNLIFLTMQEVARILKVHPSTISRMIQAKEMPAIRFGGSIRVRQVDLLKYIHAHTQNSMDV